MALAESCAIHWEKKRTSSQKGRENRGGTVQVIHNSSAMSACRRVELFLVGMSVKQLALWTNLCSCCNAHLLLLGLLDTVLGGSVVDPALSLPCCCWLSRRALQWYPGGFLLWSWGYVTSTFPRHHDSVGIILGSLK